MWHSFLALPLFVRVIAWASVGVLSLVAMVKARALNAASPASWNAVSEHFRNRVRAWLGAGPHGGSNRTYKGKFEDYRYTGSPGAYLLSLSQNGVTTTVPILETRMLSFMKKGTLVEIDTEVLRGVESVQRVRVYAQFS